MNPLILYFELFLFHRRENTIRKKKAKTEN
jgi:hypothetical protein